MAYVKIHPSSVVDRGAEIGEGTVIWHFCHISTGSKIGTNCSLGQNVFVALNVKVGNGVKIQNNVSLFSGVEIEDNVFLGPSCVFTNILIPRSEINRKHEFKKTLIKTGASIGANAVILCNNEIGRYALVGAGSVVTRSVKDFELVAGNPARHRGWVDRFGNKLEFDNNGWANYPDCTHKYFLKDNSVEEYAN